MKNSYIFIVAFSPVGSGLSGGDRIFIEFARHLAKQNKVTIATWKDGIEMCARNGINKNSVGLVKIKIPNIISNNFFLCYIARIILGIKWAYTTPIVERSIIYSASEFLMDVIPAVIYKYRCKSSKLICTWFQTAPNPIKGYSEGDRNNKYRANALLYWLSQKITKPFIKKYSNYILVNNDDEKKHFPQHLKNNRLFVVLGGVDVERISDWKKQNKNTTSKFDGIYQGRFHAQKGVVELIDIWNSVVKRIPKAKLAMIGDGPLMGEVKRRIKEYQLEKNIDLFGYVFDGDKKYKIFQSGKVVLHPAYYDSGGMASAEAMIFGLPVVGFDLVSYRSYYPQGMLKAKIGDKDKFAEIVIDLLQDDLKRKKIGKEAQELVETRLSWSKKTHDIFSKI